VEAFIEVTNHLVDIEVKDPRPGGGSSKTSFSASARLRVKERSAARWFPFAA
jgi:hypothetical protein